MKLCVIIVVVTREGSHKKLIREAVECGSIKVLTFKISSNNKRCKATQLSIVQDSLNYAREQGIPSEVPVAVIFDTVIPLTNGRNLKEVLLESAELTIYDVVYLAGHMCECDKTREIDEIRKDKRRFHNYTRVHGQQGLDAVMYSAIGKKIFSDVTRVPNPDKVRAISVNPYLFEYDTYHSSSDEDNDRVRKCAPIQRLPPIVQKTQSLNILLLILILILILIVAAALIKIGPQ